MSSKRADTGSPGRRGRALASACASGLLALVLAAPSAATDPAPATERPGLVADLAFDPDTPAPHIGVDLAPEGQPPFVLIVDTGAATSLMTVGAARERGVSIRKLKHTAYRKRTRLGRDLLFYVDSRWSDTGNNRNLELALLGADFLDDYVLEIDYPARRLRFFDPGVVQVPEASREPDLHVMPFIHNGTRMLVNSELGGQVFLGLFDTGAPSVVVTLPQAEKLGIDEGELGREIVTTSWMYGDARNRVYPARDLRVGDWALPPMPILIELSSPMNLPHGAVLGHDVWGRGVVRIDFARRRISVRESGGAAPPFRGSLEAIDAGDAAMERSAPPEG